MVPRSMGSEWRGTSNCVCTARHCGTSCLASFGQSLASAFAFSRALSAVGLGCSPAQRSQSCSRSILCKQRIHS